VADSPAAWERADLGYAANAIAAATRDVLRM